MVENDKSIAPINNGDELELECISIGKKGDGICKHKGYVVVVPLAEKGKKYMVKIEKALPKIGFGKIVNEVE